MLGAMAAGRQVGGPGELLGSAGKLIGQSPELTALTDQVRGRLVEAGKGAAMAVASRQVEALTDRVGRRVESLGDLGAGKRAATEKLDDYAGFEDVDSRNGSGDDDPPEDAPAEAWDEAPNDAAPKPSDDTDQPKRPARRARASADSGGSGSSGSGRSASARSGGTRRSSARSSASASEGCGTAKRAAAGTARRAAAGTAASARRTTTKATGQRRSARSTRSGGEESDG
jgi:hypothetical protein